MTYSAFNLDSFGNDDPHILTVLLVGTEENIRKYIHRQHSLGVTEAGAWSKLLPVPNCPGKSMSILNTTCPDCRTGFGAIAETSNEPRSPQPKRIPFGETALEHFCLIFGCGIE